MEITEEDFPSPRELIIINSDEELRNNITCFVTDGEYKLPVIDFSRYTLLLARGGGGGFRVTRIDLQQISSQTYVMNVATRHYFHQEFSYWHIAVITNKLEEGSNVKLNII